jgi:hypothetical protein
MVQTVDLGGLFHPRPTAFNQIIEWNDKVITYPLICRVIFGEEELISIWLLTHTELNSSDLSWTD